MLRFKYQSLKEIFLFFKGFAASPSSIGSVFPSSQSLASHISKHASKMSHDSMRYLEVGAGSGALTGCIASKLRKEDVFDIVEVDPKFCSHLKQKFGHNSKLTIYERSILEFESPPYDIVISSLPLNAFHSEMVKKILNKLKGLVKKNGHLSYFEYIGLQELKRLLLLGNARLDFKETQNYKKKFADLYCKEVERIWLNFPPAKVIHCKIE